VDRSATPLAGQGLKQLAPALLSHPDVVDPVDQATSAALPMKASEPVVVVRLRADLALRRLNDHG